MLCDTILSPTGIHPELAVFVDPTSESSLKTLRLKAPFDGQLRIQVAAKHALSTFIDGKALTPSQIEFIDLVIDHLTERGVLDPRRLYESPFTDIDDQGVSGIFSLGDVKELVKVINDVKARAAA